MSTLIGTVGFFNQDTARGVIHPDIEFQSNGLNIALTPEGVQQSGLHISSGLRITCTIGQGQEGAQAFDVKEYHGTGV